MKKLHLIKTGSKDKCVNCVNKGPVAKSLMFKIIHDPRPSMTWMEENICFHVVGQKYSVWVSKLPFSFQVDSVLIGQKMCQFLSLLKIKSQGRG